jgi:hypothetical protein
MSRPPSNPSGATGYAGAPRPPPTTHQPTNTPPQHTPTPTNPQTPHTTCHVPPPRQPATAAPATPSSTELVDHHDAAPSNPAQLSAAQRQRTTQTPRHGQQLGYDRQHRGRPPAARRRQPNRTAPPHYTRRPQPRSRTPPGPQPCSSGLPALPWRDVHAAQHPRRRTALPDMPRRAAHRAGAARVDRPNVRVSPGGPGPGGWPS